MMEEFERFYGAIVGGMIHDIQAAVDGKANFLASLGLLSYSEVLGWIKSGGKLTKGRAFYSFVKDKKLMPPSYESLSERSPNAYNVLRSNLVHTYGLKTKGFVKMEGCPSDGCAIRVVPTRDSWEVRIYVRQFRRLQASRSVVS